MLFRSTQVKPARRFQGEISQTPQSVDAPIAPPLTGEVQLAVNLPGPCGPGRLRHALQQLGFAFAHVGQFAVMFVVALPPTVVITPPHIAHSCFEPTATLCGASLPLVFVADIAVTTVSLQAWQTIAGAVAAGVEAWAVDLPADCQYWNPGPA